MNSVNVLTQITAEMASKGFYPKDLNLNGELTRFDRNGNDNAWCVAHENRTKSGKLFGVVIYADWKEDVRYKYCTEQNYSEEDKIEINHFLIRKQEEATQEREKEQREARQEAKKLWNAGQTAETHKYLEKKKISNSLGAKTVKIQNSNLLIVPIINVYGDIQGLQKIKESGEKRFIKGQAIKGNFIVLPVGHSLKDKQTIYVCEGYATGVSIHEATKQPVICALSAQNLSSVCWALKEYNPQLDLIVAGDNDQKNPVNIGRTKATLAAQETNSKLVFPKFQKEDDDGSDWNDVCVKYGLQEVIRQLALFEEVEAHQPLPTILASQFLETKKMTFDDKNRLVVWRKEFYQFTGKFYKRLIDSDLLNDVLSFLQKHPIAWSKSKPSLAKDVLGLIESKANVKSENPHPFWISNVRLSVKDIITLSNGIIDLSNVKNNADVQLLPHSSDLLQTTCLDFDYDPKGRCGKWQNFLDDMLPDNETQRSLQEWFGYNLVFDTTFQKFALFFGQGANGKTVCCIVLKALLGEKNISAVNVEAFDPKRTFNIASTVGKLANIVEELNSDSKTAEGELKKFVSGGIITVERKGKDPFEMVPTARLTFATNTLPKFSDSSNALWRRLLLYPFKKQILDSSKQDRRLVDPQFWIDSGELSGIFNWALEGLLRLRQSGEFTESSEMKEALGNFEKDSNPTREYILDNCELSQGFELSTLELYEKYRKFMLDSGIQPLPINVFLKEVKLVFPDIVKSKNAKLIKGKRVRFWYNLSLKDGVGSGL